MTYFDIEINGVTDGGSRGTIVPIDVTEEKRINCTDGPGKHSFGATKRDVPIQQAKGPTFATSQTSGVRQVPIKQETTIPEKRDVSIQKERQSGVPTRNRASSLNPFLNEEDECVKTNGLSQTGDKSTTNGTALATEEACFACDACTQTEKQEKKGVCAVM